jgi:hypothetical protein
VVFILGRLNIKLFQAPAVSGQSITDSILHFYELVCNLIVGQFCGHNPDTHARFDFILFDIFA